MDYVTVQAADSSDCRAALVIVQTACAQASTPKVQFDIAPQVASSALIEFGRQADITVLVASGVRDIDVPGLKGAYGVEEGLELLVKGTGLQYRISHQSIFVDQEATSAKKIEPPATKNPPTAGPGVDRDRKRGAFAVFIAAVLGTSAVDGRADQEPEARPTTQLGEVVVTAQKRKERLQDVPVPVTVVSTETLLERNQLSLRDYYVSLPGVSLATGRSTRGDPDVSIRGITAGTGYNNPTVAILVDDVPYGSSTGIGGGNSIPDFDPGDLARIEVLRGPQGTLYGASSLGGLIKYVTTDPSTEGFSGRVQIGTSHADSGELGYNARGWVNVPITNTFAVRASGFTRRDPGYIYNVQTGKDNVNRVDVTGGLLSAMWEPSASFLLKVSTLYQNAEADGASLVDPFFDLGDLEQTVLRGIGGYDKERIGILASMEARLGDVDVTSLTGYTVNEASFSNDWKYPGLGEFLVQQMQDFFGVSGAAQIEDTKTKKFSQELRLSSSLGERIDWLLGGFYTHEDTTWVQDEAAIDPSTGEHVGTLILFDFPTTVEEWAVFGNLTFNFTDQFSIQVGARQGWNDQTYSEVDSGPAVPLFYGVPSPNVEPELQIDDSAFTYLITPQYRLSPDVMVYGRIASGYRMGGPNFTCTAFGIPCEFGPDETINYEIGLKGSILDGLLSFDASLYYIDWKDIQLTVTHPNGVAYFTNGSRAKSEGVELSVQSQPLRGLTVAAWFVWNAAELTDPLPPESPVIGVSGDRLPNSSRYSGHFSLQQDFSLTANMNGFVGASVSYVGDRLGAFTATTSRPEYPDYTRMDMRAGVRRHPWALDLFVTNVTDKRGVLSGDLDILPGPLDYIQPRTIGLSVAREF